MTSLKNASRGDCAHLRESVLPKQLERLGRGPHEGPRIVRQHVKASRAVGKKHTRAVALLSAGGQKAVSPVRDT